MPALPVPDELIARYAHLSTDDLRSLLSTTLERQSKDVDEVLNHWLIALSFTEIRPRAKTNISTMEHRKWLAFALCYLQPLLTGGSANTYRAVLDELINASEEQLGQLLWGPADDAQNILQAAFDRSTKGKAFPLEDWQQAAVKALRPGDRTDDVIKHWREHFIALTVDAAVKHFRPQQGLAVQESAQAFLNRPERPSGTYRELFARYVEVAKQRDGQKYYMQALGYRNEFAGRLSLINQYAGVARNTSFGFGVLTIFLTWVWRGETLARFLPALFIAGEFGLFYTRLFNSVVDTFTWAATAQQTLEEVLGKLPDVDETD